MNLVKEKFIILKTDYALEYVIITEKINVRDIGYILADVK